MIYKNDKISEMKIAYIGGGSRGWAWTFMTDLAMEQQLSGTICLYDIDKDAAEKNAIIGNRLSARADTVGKWQYENAGSLQEALTGADFVVISILPGTFDEMEVDVHLPERHMVYQAVGDTAGPGGISRSLRTVPMFVEIAKAVEQYAPEAWVINYTNPMTMCVKTLYAAFPNIKAFGCCHEVFSTQKLLAAMCEELLGLTGIKREDIFVNVLGINHFTWFNQASYKGIDLFPLYTQFVDRHYTEGYNEPDRNWANSTFNCAHRVKFDLFRRFGLIAAAGDRHLAEFMPCDEYLHDAETVHEFKFGLTTVEWRKNDLKTRMEKSNRLVEGKEAVELKASGEEGIRLIKALCGLERMVSNVNLPNTDGQIANLPRTAVVETNALFERDAVRPVQAGEIPHQVLKLVEPHVQNHEYILQAALRCDRAQVLQALRNDPLCKGKLTTAETETLLDDLIDGSRKYLSKQWFT